MVDLLSGMPMRTSTEPLRKVDYPPRASRRVPWQLDSIDEGERRVEDAARMEDDFPSERRHLDSTGILQKEASRHIRGIRSSRSQWYGRLAAAHRAALFEQWYRRLVYFSQ